MLVKLGIGLGGEEGEDEGQSRRQGEEERAWGVNSLFVQGSWGCVWDPGEMYSQREFPGVGDGTWSQGRGEGDSEHAGEPDLPLRGGGGVSSGALPF